jgi:hypothetical protein
VDDLVRKCRRADVAHVRVAPAALCAPGAVHADAAAATEKARAALAADPRVAEAAIGEDQTIEVRAASPEQDASFISELLVRQGFPVHYFSEEPLTLEDAFLRLTSGAEEKQY